MKALLRKEFSLSFFALPYLFWLLAGFVLIPNYPYFVSFFYTTLGVMFLFQYNRENRDVAYMMTLPISKRQMVLSRFCQVVIIEVGQILVFIPFMLLRGSYAHIHNLVGFEANVAFLGLGLVMLGLFNRIFLPGFYKNAHSIGIPFLKGSFLSAVYIILVEVLLRIVPYFRTYCDSMALQDQLMQIPVLLVGIVLYGALTIWSYRISIRRFELLDL